MRTLRALFEMRLTASLRYRMVLALALTTFGLGVVDSLIWVYVLYSRELADRDLRVIAVLILMLALTFASLLMVRFAKKRMRALPDSNQDTGSNTDSTKCKRPPTEAALLVFPALLLFQHHRALQIVASYLYQSHARVLAHELGEAHTVGCLCA